MPVRVEQNISKDYTAQKAMAREEIKISSIIRDSSNLLVTSFFVFFVGQE